MNIAELWLHIKRLTDLVIGEWGVLAIVLLVGIASFGLGRLSLAGSLSAPVSILQAPERMVPHAMYAGGLVVASNNATTYYFPWCAGAEKIKPENRLWFASEKDAQAHGLVPAKNCKGLQ